MAVCGVCGKNSILPESYDSLVLCKKCALKIWSPKWKAKVFTTNEEIEKERDSVTKKALHLGFPQTALDALVRYFDDQKIEGLVRLFDGRVGQILTVFKGHCVIDTQDEFDYEEIDEAYRLMMTPAFRGKCSARPCEEETSIDGEALAGAAKDIISGLALGGSLSKSVMRAGAGLASSATSKPRKNEKAVVANVELRIEYGLATLRYSDLEDVFLRMPVGEEEYGFIRFQRGKEPNPTKDKLFFFEESESSKKVVKELQRYMQKEVSSFVDERERMAREAEEAVKARAMEVEEAKESLVIEAIKSSSAQTCLSAPDELLKWKQLLDAGAISQEEYETKKAQLLGI